MAAAPFYALITPVDIVQPPGSPPVIWGGGNVPMPTPPIANAPGMPGYTPPPGSPPGTWGGGNVPMPSPPIANAPGVPGYQPPPGGIWGPYPGFPTPPISGIPGLPGYNPPLPTNPPEVVKEVPPEGGWGAAEVDGKLVWVYVPGEGAPSPKT